MGSDVRTSSSVGVDGGPLERAAYWLLVDAHRLLVAGGIVVVAVVVVRALVWADLLVVGSNGYAATLFGSGLTSGVATLLTVALSINQLILSRVFGSPDELSDRLEGTRELRDRVTTLAGESASPNDPATFLSLVARTLTERAETLQENVAASGWTPPDEVSAAIGDVVDYGRNVDDHLDDGADIIDVLDVILGAEYAWNMTAVEYVSTEYADSLSTEVRDDLRALDDLLESIAVTRQFFKTFTLQQDFAELSRLVVYSGLLALLVTVSLTFVYRTNAATVPASMLPLVVSAGVGAVVAPFAVFVSYLLRASTIAHRTVSVGPFVPPDQQ